MNRQLTLSAVEVPVVRAAIESGAPVWLVRDGVRQYVGLKPMPVSRPAEFVQASAPCGTCGDERRAYGYLRAGRPCPDCRVELVGQCPTCEGAGWDWGAYSDSGTDCEDPVASWTCDTCFVKTATENGLSLGHCTGTVTIAHAYAIREPVAIVSLYGEDGTDAPIVAVGERTADYFDRGNTHGWHDITAALAHYGPPEALVGKWAQQFQAVQ